MKSFFQIKVKNLRVREKSDLAQNISAIKERMHFFTQEQKEVGIVVDQSNFKQYLLPPICFSSQSYQLKRKFYPFVLQLHVFDLKRHFFIII